MTTLGAPRYELDLEWLAEQQKERVCQRTWPTSSCRDRVKLPVSASLERKMWKLLLTCYSTDNNDKEYALI